MNYFAVKRHVENKARAESNRFVTYDHDSQSLKFWHSETEAREWVREFGGVYAAID